MKFFENTFREHGLDLRYNYNMKILQTRKHWLGVMFDFKHDKKKLAGFMTCFTKPYSIMTNLINCGFASSVYLAAILL